MVLICSSMFIRINLQTVYNIVISNNCTQTHDLKAGWAISGSQSWYLKSPKQKPQKGPAPILIDPPHIYVNLTEHIYLFFTRYLYLSVTQLGCSLNALSSISWVDTPITADWLQVYFVTRPDSVF